MKPLLVANWKMNASLPFLEAFAEELMTFSSLGALADWVVCPPYPYLSEVRKNLQPLPVQLGAQDVSAFMSGAFTGDVSAAMLSEFGCSYVIVGHSERRCGIGETSELCAKKLQAALAQGLMGIYCIGESLEQRQKNTWRDSLKTQLQPVLSLSESDWQSVVIAYEPVWAIGSGQAATLEQIHEVHAFVRSLISQLHQTLAQSVKILYGGSVSPDNAGQLFADREVNGFLIGGASLKADSFYNIGVACSRSC